MGKHLHVNESMQFRPTLLRSQLYSKEFSVSLKREK